VRTPNPWIAVPVLLATAVGGVVGFQITRVSCAPGSCFGAATGIGIVAALAAFFGVGTVVVLAARSIAEWRRQEEQSGPPPRDPGPPAC
jgi:hypothetical protein